MTVRRNQYREQKVDLRVALLALQAAGRPPRVGEFVLELVDMFDCSESVARDTIGILLKAGYLDETRDPADKRCRLLAVTRNGVAVATAAYGDQVLRFARRLYTSSPSSALTRGQEWIAEHGGPRRALERAEKILLAAETESDSTPDSVEPAPTKRRHVNARLQKLASGSCAGRPLTRNDLELIVEQAQYEAAFELLQRHQDHDLAESMRTLVRVRRAVEAGVLDVTAADLLTLSDIAPSPIGRMIYDALLRLHALRILIRCLLTPAQAEQVLVADTLTRHARDQKRSNTPRRQKAPPRVDPLGGRMPEITQALAANARIEHEEMKIHLEAVEEFAILLGVMQGTLDESEIGLLNTELARLEKSSATSDATLSTAPTSG